MAQLRQGVWYNVAVDAENNELDREIVERLRCLQIDLEDLQARFDELMEDLRHGENWTGEE